MKTHGRVARKRSREKWGKNIRNGIYPRKSRKLQYEPRVFSSILPLGLLAAGTALRNKCPVVCSPSHLGSSSSDSRLFFFCVHSLGPQDFIGRFVTKFLTGKNNPKMRTRERWRIRRRLWRRVWPRDEDEWEEEHKYEGEE